MAALEAAPANVHDSFSDSTHDTAESSGISPAAVVAVAAGTDIVCQSGRAFQGSSASSMRPLPYSDLAVSPLTAEGRNTVVAYSADAHSAEAQNAKGQAVQGANAHSTGAAQHADAHDADAHSAAVYSKDAQGADAQTVQGTGAGILVAQTQPAEAHSAEAIKAQAGDAEAPRLFGDTAVQLMEFDDSGVTADMTPALLASRPGTLRGDHAGASTEQAVTTTAPEDAAPSDSRDSAPSKAACTLTAH
ncbi:TPA: hypothetical protein ACH3X1_005444 [Trebouxia sp. C0004]